MKIAILGIQGSGKSTQAELVSKKYGIPFISMGRVLREMGEEHTKQGEMIKHYTQQGILIPDEIVKSIIDNLLSKPEYDKGYILDGYPRQLSQARHIDHYVDHVVYVKLSDKEALWRLAHRKEERDDNNLGVILRRIQIFHDSIDPVIDFFKTNSKLVEIDGEPGIELVFKQIEDKLSPDA